MNNYLIEIDNQITTISSFQLQKLKEEKKKVIVLMEIPLINSGILLPSIKRNK